MNILHLSHTDIAYDSRILKEMNTVSSYFTSSKVSGIGVILNESTSSSKQSKNLNIYSIKLLTKKWTLLPRGLRHFFSLIELTIKMIYKALRLKPQILHCHDTLVLPLGLILKLFTGAKLVYDAHELESDRNGLSKTLGYFTLFIEKMAWRAIDALIVVSPSIDKWYQENIGNKYSEIIFNSPVLEELGSKTDINYLRNFFSIPKDSKIFLYIGILGHGRGIELITEVFKQHYLKSSLVFLGYGELSKELKTIARQHKNIYVHDAVPHEQVVSVAQSADVGLCLIQNISLSDYYCLPNKLFEYAFSEIPVLASNFPDIVDTVKKYNLGFCTELDPNKIVNKIQEIENKKELKKINSHELYELSWARKEEKLIKLYSSLLTK